MPANDQSSAQRTITLEFDQDVKMTITGDNPIAAIAEFNQAYPGRMTSTHERGVVYIHLTAWLQARGYAVALRAMRERGWINYFLTRAWLALSRSLYERCGLDAYRIEAEERGQAHGK